MSPKAIDWLAKVLPDRWRTQCALALKVAHLTGRQMTGDHLTTVQEILRAQIPQVAQVDARGVV